METTFSREHLAALLKHALGSQTELRDFQVANQYPDYYVLLVQLNRPEAEVVVKLAGPQSPMASAFDRTAMIHNLVAIRTDIPMPETLAVNMDFEAWPWRYLVRTHIPGMVWAEARQHMDAGESEHAFHQFGRAVGQLHAIQFQGWGSLSADGSLKDSASYLDALVDHARHIITSPRLQDLFLLVIEKNRTLFQQVFPASLCHEDLHHFNILFQRNNDDWRLATILDFDKAWAGSPETDLARLELWRGMTHPAFWQAYAAFQTIDPYYVQRRPIYQLLWCLEYAQNTPAHLADTRRLCALLGVPCIDQFD